MPQLALQHCNPARLWQAPSSGLSVIAQCTSMPVLEVASSSGVRTKGFSLSLQRFKVSPRTGSQRCNSVSNSPTGRNTEEMQGAEFEQLGEEDLDALFEEYGEKWSGSITVALAEAANDVKGSGIQVLCVKPLMYWARFFDVVTGFSKPQIDAAGFVDIQSLVEAFTRCRLKNAIL